MGKFVVLGALLVALYWHLGTQITLASAEGPAPTPDTFLSTWTVEYEETHTIEVPIPGTGGVQIVTAEYSIVRGDTLSGISKAFYGTPDRYPEIATKNGLTNPNLLWVGQKVLVDTEQVVPPQMEKKVVTERKTLVWTPNVPVTTAASAPLSKSGGTELTVLATAYSCSQIEGTSHFVGGVEVCNNTATGSTPTWGTIAVDPSIIPLWTQVTIAEFPNVTFTAQDTGGAIRGNRIDIWFPTHAQAIQFGSRTVHVTILDGKVVAAYASTATIPIKTETWQWPVTGKISDPFGACRNSTCTDWHTGIDIDLFYARDSHTQIKAVKSGQVIASDCVNTDNYGCKIIIDHGDGYSSLYAHLSKQLVKVGDSVSQGQVVGISGITGLTTGEHLHFEIRKKGVPIDPLSLLN